MKTSGKATRWPRTANPVLAALRKPAVRRLNGLMIDLQANEALASLRAGRLSAFDAKVLEAIVFVTRKLAKQGVGPESLACAERCQALLPILRNPRACQPDQVAAFAELVDWNQAQRDADQDAFTAAALPFIR